MLWPPCWGIKRKTIPWERTEGGTLGLCGIFKPTLNCLHLDFIHRREN